SWRGGPQVPVPTLLRTVGRSGPRGRGAAPRDDTMAKTEVAEARARRQAGHHKALAAVLAALPGQQLDEAAARIALAALMAAARATPTGPRRTGTSGGLACTLLHTSSGTGILNAPTWQVLLPGRIPLFHRPGQRPTTAALAALADTTTTDDPSPHATLRITPHTGPRPPDTGTSPLVARQEGAA
ncbi:DUF2397 family protein, partial [Streptomyces noursei]